MKKNHKDKDGFWSDGVPREGNIEIKIKNAQKHKYAQICTNMHKISYDSRTALVLF